MLIYVWTFNCLFYRLSFRFSSGNKKNKNWLPSKKLMKWRWRIVVAPVFFCSRSLLNCFLMLFFEQRTYALLVSTCVVHIDFQIKIFKISILLVLLLRSSLCFCYGHSIPKNWCRKSRINYRLFFRLLTKIVFEIDRKQNLRQTRNMTGTYW